MTTSHRKIILLLLTCLFSMHTMAARYIYEQIPEQDIRAINSSGTLIGITANKPFVWYRDNSTDLPEGAQRYLSANKFDLPLLENIPQNQIQIVDINNELPDGSGGTILGWYQDENGLPQSLIWTKARLRNSFPQSYTLTTGNQSSGTYSNTTEIDKIYHQHIDTAGVLDLYYQFDVLGDGIPGSVKFSGYLTGINNSVFVYAYNWTLGTWDQLGSLKGQSETVDGGIINIPSSFSLSSSHVGIGTNSGEVRIRFYAASGLTSATLAIDQIYVGVLPKNEPLFYAAKKIKPHILTATPCKDTGEIDYNIPECINQNDNALITKALGCEGNKDWVPGNAILVDPDWSPIVLNSEGKPVLDGNGNTIRNTSTLPNCNKSLPICDFKIAKVKFIIEQRQGDVIEQVESFRYLYLNDYLEQKCVAPAHVDLIKSGFECVEENFTKNPKEIPPVIIQCDNASKASGINNDGMISGTSFKKDGKERPVFWIKKDETDSNGIPNYASGDLGLQRTTVLQTLGNDSSKSSTQLTNEDLESRTRFNLTIAEVQKTADDPISLRIVSADKINPPTIKLLKTDDGLIEQTFKTVYKEGNSINIDKFRNAIVGFIKDNTEETVLKPVYWPSVNFSEVLDPKQLFAPKLIGTRQGDCPNKLFEKFNNNVTIESASGGNIVGWFTDENLLNKPIFWQAAPCKDRNNITSEEYEPLVINTLDVDLNTGKALDNNNAETIGTADIKVQDNQNSTEPRAFYRTNVCGIQDLNELLVNPTTDITLSEATRLAAGTTNSPLVTRGRDNVNNSENNVYVLQPQPVYLDLKVSIATDHNTLIVGDQHTLFVTVTNEGSPDESKYPDNYATCVKFEVKASVVTDGVIENEKLGGLTFKGYEASDRVFCATGPVSIICAIEKLGNNEFITTQIFTEPRALLADRKVRTSVAVGATEQEIIEKEDNNYAFVITDVEREGCFIATAAYGSYMAPEVKALRQFRDEVLLKTTFGKQLVELYYEFSPPLANYISNNETLRQIARWGLTPIIYGVLYPVYTAVLFLIIIFSIIFKFYKRRDAQLT